MRESGPSCCQDNSGTSRSNKPEVNTVERDRADAERDRADAAEDRARALEERLRNRAGRARPS